MRLRMHTNAFLLISGSLHPHPYACAVLREDAKGKKVRDVIWEPNTAPARLLGKRPGSQ